MDLRALLAYLLGPHDPPSIAHNESKMMSATRFQDLTRRTEASLSSATIQHNSQRMECVVRGTI